MITTRCQVMSPATIISSPVRRVPLRLLAVLSKPSSRRGALPRSTVPSTHPVPRSPRLSLSSTPKTGMNFSSQNRLSQKGSDGSRTPRASGAGKARLTDPIEAKDPRAWARESIGAWSCARHPRRYPPWAISSCKRGAGVRVCRLAVGPVLPRPSPAPEAPGMTPDRHASHKGMAQHYREEPIGMEANKANKTDRRVSTPRMPAFHEIRCPFRRSEWTHPPRRPRV